MLKFLRVLAGQKTEQQRPQGIDQSALTLPPPVVVTIDGLPDFQIARHLDRHEGLPLVRWAEAASWLSALESPDSQARAWEAMEKAWLLHFREALGPRFRLREGESALRLSSLDDGVAKATLNYMTRTLKRVAVTLDGLAQVPPWGKDILIVFDDAESYYIHVSRYYLTRVNSHPAAGCTSTMVAPIS